MEEETSPTRLKVRVDRVVALTDRIKTFELSAIEVALPRFEAGAHIEVLTGIGVARSYSLANDPAETHRYLIAVLREPQGLGSRWMHDRVSAGDLLNVMGPHNAFALDETAAEHLLIAGGIGITPILSMTHRLTAIGARFQLLFCTRSAAETPFAAELQQRFGDRVTIHHDGGDPTRSFDLAALLRKRPVGAHVYVCGPRGMIQAVRSAAQHWSAETVHFEIFASPTVGTWNAETVSATPETNDVPFEVQLSSTGQVFAIPADRTILDVLLEAGLNVPYVCKEGWCGNCQLGLLGGCADHRDDVLSDEERAANSAIQICVSRAVRGERLILDR
jgi:ferredoxin-NADP reductase